MNEKEKSQQGNKKLERFLSWQHSWIRSSTAQEVVQEERTAANQAWKPTILPLLKPLKALLPTDVFIAPSQKLPNCLPDAICDGYFGSTFPLNLLEHLRKCFLISSKAEKSKGCHKWLKARMILNLVS